MAIAQEALDKLLDLIGGDSDSLAELIESFLEESSTLIEQMRSAAEAGDQQTLGRAAHTLKSSGRDFGAVHLSELCQDMEMSCRVGLPSGAVADVEVIAGILNTAKKELFERLSVLRGGK